MAIICGAIYYLFIGFCYVFSPQQYKPFAPTTHTLPLCCVGREINNDDCVNGKTRMRTTTARPNEMIFCELNNDLGMVKMLFVAIFRECKHFADTFFSSGLM